jgi:hypothetical protein
LFAPFFVSRNDGLLKPFQAIAHRGIATKQTALQRVAATNKPALRVQQEMAIR